MPIMPTPKPKWVYVVRQYNWKTGKHEVIEKHDVKEVVSDRVIVLRELHKNEPLNFEYEKIDDTRPDLHHEKLMEEWGYKK